jgi:cyclase
MTLTRRVVACLDVKHGRVVKGTQFVNLRDVGDPVKLAEYYEREGADEIVFLDIAASATDSQSVLDLARRAAERLFVPLTIGGGIRDVEDVARALRAGADKVGINTAAVARPELLTECAARFGSQCVVASIDAKAGPDGRYEVFVRGGRMPTGLGAIEWARRCVDAGAGEILITSMDRDGSRGGYELTLTQQVVEAVHVPVVASGGAGSAGHVAEVLAATGADAALVAGIVHDGTTTIAEIKRRIVLEGIPVRSSSNE